MKSIAFIPVGVFSVLVVLFVLAIFHGDPSRVPSAMIGRKVPDFTLPSLPELGVPGLASSDFGKGQVVIVNVFASWCVPCREEHDVLLELKRLAPAPIYAINYKDDADAARRFLNELGNPFVKVGDDQSGRVAIDWGVYGVPETYIVDGNRLIVYKYVGPLTPQALESELLPALRRAKTGG